MKVYCDDCEHKRVQIMGLCEIEGYREVTEIHLILLSALLEVLK